MSLFICLGDYERRIDIPPKQSLEVYFIYSYSSCHGVIRVKTSKLGQNVALKEYKYCLVWLIIFEARFDAKGAWTRACGDGTFPVPLWFVGF